MTDDEIDQFAHTHLYRSLRPIGLNEFARAIEAHVLKEARRTVSGQEAVGVVGTMPGTEGFTMACFEADHVPVGTKLYAAPIPATELKDAEQ